MATLTGTVPGFWLRWDAMIRPSRKLAALFKWINLEREATETLVQSSSSRTDGTKRLSSCNMPLTWIQITGSTIAFSVAHTSRKEDCRIRLSKHSNMGWRWRGIRDSGQVGHAYAVSAKTAEAEKTLDHLNELSTHSYVAPYNVAVIYAGLGEKDAAFAWLNRAKEDRSYLLAEYLKTDARLDSLRSDPRFAELVRKIGLPQ